MRFKTIKDFNGIRPLNELYSVKLSDLMDANPFQEE